MAGNRCRGIDPSLVAFDIDSVIADTMGLFLDIAREEYRIDHICYDDITNYDLTACLDMAPDIIESILKRIQNGGYTSTLKPVPGASEVLSKVSRYHRPILMVTARPYPGPIEAWIHLTLGLDASAVEIIATGSYDAKIEILTDRSVSFFVEDRLETCYTLHGAGIVPIVFKQPWNRAYHPFVEVESWRDIESLLDLEVCPSELRA